MIISSWTTLAHKLARCVYYFALICFMTACQDNNEIHTLKGQTMGTNYSIKYIDKSGKLNSQEVHQQIKIVLAKVNQQMSTYIDDSELSRFNQLREINQAVPISADLAEVIEQSIAIYSQTQGAFDITVGPLVNLWGFGPEKRQVSPSPAEIAQRKSWVGLDKLTFQKNNGQPTIAKKVPELYVDLSGIAKGYGIDKVAEQLEHLNINDYLVEIGGDLRAKGLKNATTAWSIGIEKPNYHGLQEIQQIIYLKDIALTTSGDYRNYVNENGQRYSHEIDPATALPAISDIASISILMPSATVADGLATGLLVLGSETALSLAEQNNWPIHVIIHSDDGFIIKQSSAFERLLQ